MKLPHTIEAKIFLGGNEVFPHLKLFLSLASLEFQEPKEKRGRMKREVGRKRREIRVWERTKRRGLLNTINYITLSTLSSVLLEGVTVRGCSGGAEAFV